MIIPNEVLDNEMDPWDTGSYIHWKLQRRVHNILIMGLGLSVLRDSWCGRHLTSSAVWLSRLLHKCVTLVLASHVSDRQEMSGYLRQHLASQRRNRRPQSVYCGRHRLFVNVVYNVKNL
jgi:hypothetical protein